MDIAVTNFRTGLLSAGEWIRTVSLEVLAAQTSVGRNCNTRETILERDGTDVVQSSSCGATSGSWVSPYDGETWTAASDVDIDHLVPLSNAWKVRQTYLTK